MKVQAFIDVETKQSVQKILEETDLNPLIKLGKKIWIVKGEEFEINIPGGKLKYIPDIKNHIFEDE